jgi:pimeloyl-ACP methyl ester carboxylesterase
VDLWRDFPALLSTTTGPPVIAYDRLGFGRSDPYPGALELEFVRNEGRYGLPALRAVFGLDRMILFGHSVGGGMAVPAAAGLPDTTVAVITEAAHHDAPG